MEACDLIEKKAVSRFIKYGLSLCVLVVRNE